MTAATKDTTGDIESQKSKRVMDLKPEPGETTTLDDEICLDGLYTPVVGITKTTLRDLMAGFGRASVEASVTASAKRASLLSIDSRI